MVSVYRSATVRVAVATVLAAGSLLAQAVPESWRHIGNSVVDRSLADLATGPVDRVWFLPSGPLLAHTAEGVFETADFETWHPASATPPASDPEQFTPVRLPEPDALVRSRPGSTIAYAVGQFVYRSDDGGASWQNLTGYRGISILGGALRDVAISPGSDDQVVVAGADGVFRSMDGGRSWSGLNQGLPNLPATRLLSLPSGDDGVRLALGDGTAVVWEPGQKRAWLPTDNADVTAETEQRRAYSARFGVRSPRSLRRAITFTRGWRTAGSRYRQTGERPGAPRFLTAQAQWSASGWMPATRGSRWLHWARALRTCPACPPHTWSAPRMAANGTISRETCRYRREWDHSRSHFGRDLRGDRRWRIHGILQLRRAGPSSAVDSSRAARARTGDGCKARCAGQSALGCSGRLRSLFDSGATSRARSAGGEHSRI